MKLLAINAAIIEQSGILETNAKLAETNDFAGFDGFELSDESASDTPKVFETEGSIGGFERVVVEGLSANSQLDRLKSCRSNAPVMALALDGRQFHGQHGRPWISGLGNLYLSLYLPNATLKSIGLDRLDDGFQAEDLLGTCLSEIQTNRLFNMQQTQMRLMMMPCRAVFETLQGLGLAPALRYPNDIVMSIGDQPHKIAGCLTELTVCRDEIESARFGIGLNVKCAPRISDTGLPACCIHDFISAISVGQCCCMVCEKIGRAYCRRQ